MRRARKRARTHRIVLGLEEQIVAAVVQLVLLEHRLASVVICCPPRHYLATSIHKSTGQGRGARVAHADPKPSSHGRQPPVRIRTGEGEL
jgi:hypothetical protein